MTAAAPRGVSREEFAALRSVVAELAAQLVEFRQRLVEAERQLDLLRGDGR